MTVATDRFASREASWAERGATFTVFLTLGLLTGAWAAALPGLKAKLGLSTGELSVALFALTGGSVLATVTAGVLAPRFGTGRATGFGAIACVVGLALPPLATNLPEFAFATALLGVGIGIVDVSMNGHAGFIEERWSGPIMSSFHGAFSLGGLIGAAVGSLVAWAGGGPTGQLWSAVALGLALDLAALPFLGTGPKSEGQGSGLAMPPRAMIGVCTIVLICFVIEGGVLDWSSIYLSTVAGSSLVQASMGYAAFSVTMAVGRFLGDWITHRFGPRLVVTAGAGLAAVGLALAVALPQTLAASTGFALVGLGVSNVVPVGFSVASRLGSTPAAGVAVAATFGYAGFLAGPPIIGGVATFAGLREGLLLVAVGAAVAALIGFAALPAQAGRRSRT